MGGRRLCLAVIVALGGVLAAAPAASATFHEILIREVYPGSLAQPDSAYVELQMFTGGQQFVSGHAVTTYSAGGAVTGTFNFSSNVSNGESQRTILVGDSGVQSTFGVTPDLTSASLAISPAGGAVCWAGSYDCVAWGAFIGSTPSPVGSPADPLGIPNGMALRRTIAPGCATLLQPGDDSNASATDFSDVAPQPRNNTSAIVEAPCTGPVATIGTKPVNPTNSTAASFTYSSTTPDVSFECKLDAASFADCDTDGVQYAGPLTQGFHTFQVRAKNGAGTTGNPASYTWRVDTTAPTVTIDTHPADPSAGASASFSFHASEAGSSFQCSLALAPASGSFSPCSSGETYASLIDGSYTFEVRAKDPAGNEGPAASFGWTVDNSIVEPPPPTPPPTGDQPPAPTSAPVASAPPPPISTPVRKKRQRPRRCRRGKSSRGKTRQGKRCKRRSGKAGNRASASTFHLVMLREVYPGSSSSPDAEYVELQMYAPGQEFIQGHKVDFFGPTGASLGSVTFDADVARGGSQSTILVATAEAEAQFGVVADKGVSGGMLDPAGGAVCWETLDCVAWGGFSGSPGSPTGSPAAPLSIPDGVALRRSIAPGCATLLEVTDDRNDSALDFAAVSPAPRPNAVAPSEHACASQGPYGDAGKGPGGGANAGRRPQTRLGRRPAKTTDDRTPTFGFSSNRSGVSFLCKLDRRPFKRCRSPFTTARLQPGGHVFRVKARAPGGATDRSPAVWRFTIIAER